MRRTRAPFAFKLAFFIEAACVRLVERAEGALGSAALSWMTPRELSALTSDLYARSGPTSVDGLHPWEADWFAAALPQVPGRILVGGAGAGREAKHLQSLGHTVLGFDPVLDFVRRAAPTEGLSLMRGSYEALLAPQDARERHFAHWVDSNAPYDAILLGWVSFTHLPDPSARQALLRRLTKLCPKGPILISFWLRSEGRDGQGARDRLWRAASRLTARFRSGFVPPEPGDLVTHRGFVHLFTETELEELASAACLTLDAKGGRSSVGTCPHVTLRPRLPAA